MKKPPFKSPVAWLGGRDLLANLKYFVLFAAFKGKLDPRDWMAGRVFPTRAEWAGQRVGWDADAEAGEFWFDYLSDSGDGQAATYNLAYLCLSDLLLEGPDAAGQLAVRLKHAADYRQAAHAAEEAAHAAGQGAHETVETARAAAATTLPRGSFLFFGGDTTYHVADYASLAERFQAPFTWAFRDRRKDVRAAPAALADLEVCRPIFGIPGNHDYYDMIDGFNRQFRAPLTREDEPLTVGGRKMTPQLRLPGFERRQQASYVALRLPFGWWFWGVDSELNELDLRQREYFRRAYRDALTEAERAATTRTLPAKLVVATPEPTTVNRRRAKPEDKTPQALRALGLDNPYLRDGELWDTDAAQREGNGQTCRLDISGDTHHYARYWGPTTTTQASTAAVASSTPPVASGAAAAARGNYASLVSGSGGAAVSPTHTAAGEKDERVEPRVTYPDEAQSRKMVADRIFNPWTVFRGGNVYLFGVIISAVIFLEAWLNRIWLRGAGARAAAAATPQGAGGAAASWPWDWPGLCLLSDQPEGLLSGNYLRLLVFMLLAIGLIGAAGRYAHWLFLRLTKSFDLADRRLRRAIERQRPTGLSAADRWQCWAILALAVINNLVFLYGLGHFYGLRPLLAGNGNNCQLQTFSLPFVIVSAGLAVWSCLYAKRAYAPFETLRKAVGAGFQLRYKDVRRGVAFGEVAELKAAGLTGLRGKVSDLIVTPKTDYLPFWVLFASAAISLAYVLLEFARLTGDELVKAQGVEHIVPRLTGSLLILLTNLLAAAAALGGIFYSAGLFKQAYRIKVTFFSYWPVRAYAIFAVLCVLAGVLFFGGYDMRKVVADILFALVVAGILGGLTYFGWGVGGADVQASDRAALTALGFWHGALQLLVPFLLVWWGNVWTYAAALVLVVVFWLLGTRLGNPWFKRRLRPGGRWVALVLLIAGALALALPWLTSRLPFVSDAHAPVPTLLSSGHEYLALAVGLALAGLFGALFSCAWFGWYLAAGLAFNGHNNEVGSTVRSEQYKQFVRFRLKRERTRDAAGQDVTKETLTVYVIGVDDYARQARDMKLRLVDHFTLQAP
ncbi:MAG TPA: hypothetical protein VF546_21000 [Pyrinomonadaceae bacterium]|jgi:hypothetical protein